MYHSDTRPFRVFPKGKRREQSRFDDDADRKNEQKVNRLSDLKTPIQNIPVYCMGVSYAVINGNPLILWDWWGGA